LAEYDIPDDLVFSEHDEWVRRQGESLVVGITDYAQDQLGDIVYVAFPEVGATVKRGEPFGEIESVKAVSALYAPVDGVVAAVNGDLEDAPEKVNEDCYGAGWLIEIGEPDTSQLESLLDAAAYRRHVDERSD
jgi:glycine cleavage system H protein